MYERFYGLRERPFALSPDPEYLYPSRVHREALGYLRYGIESQAGFVVITGEIGSGKTTLLQTLVRGLDPDTTVARIVNTQLDAREFVEALMIDLGLDTGERSKPVLLKELAGFLVEQRRAGKSVLLIVDEAQNLGLAALEEIRMLSNLETEKTKLIQIVLVGQPSLRETLSRPELEQLRQRITVSYHLEPLDADDTASYIHHRLRLAALDTPLAFPRAVTAAIHARTGGVPRLINVVCDAVLVFGYAEERTDFDADLLDEVFEELEQTGVLDREARVREATVEERPSGPTGPEPIAPRTAEADPNRSLLEQRDVDEAGREAVRGSRQREQDASLRAREERLLQHERELNQQRQVLAEQQELLRRTAAQASRSFAAAPRTAARPNGEAWPPTNGRSVDRLPEPAVAMQGRPRGDVDLRGYREHHATVGAARPKSFWQRTREAIFGVG
jgi:putative secretion ATPase (PEP-CTERM system associated)